MSNINIYMNAEDKVNVKDDTQIIKLQGPKDDPGPKGEPFKYSDFTPEQLNALKGPKGDAGENGAQGVPGPQGDNVNLETVKKIKDLLLDNNVMVHSDSLEGVLLDYFEFVISGGVFVKDNGLVEPVVQISESMLIILCMIPLAIQINDGEIQYMKGISMETPLPSTTEPITIKFYNARMKLMFTKTIEVQ